MAKINGSCNGSSAAKYDLWIEIKQNSQDVAKNKSNITAQLKLKRNDGYSGSAYNLNESDNSASLKIGDEVKDSGTLKIDTRNSSVVILASWTGDVIHADDGSLTLSVSGSFTMGNSSLTGGSVSGKFKCTSIPRASSLTLSDTTVNPGDSITFGISGVSSFNHKITCKLGSVAKKTITLAAAELSGNIEIPQAWASYLKDLTKEVITITLATYKKDTLIGTKKYNVTLKIPNTADYKPSFRISLTRIDNGVPAEWGEYLKGISQVKVTLSDVEYKYDSSLKSISITYDGVTKNKNNSVFDLLKSGNDRVIKVRLTDSRGYYTEQTEKINVLNYAPPSISIQSVKRCDIDGVEKINGTYLKVFYTAKHTALGGKNNAVIKVSHFKKGASDTKTETIETVDEYVIVGGGEILETCSYVVKMTIADALKNIPAEYSIGTAGIPFNIKRGGNGAAFGCYAETDGELTVAWDFNIKGEFKSYPLEVKLNSDMVDSLNAGSTIRVFPSMKLVVLRLRMSAVAELEQGKDHLICSIPKAYPVMLTPLTTYVNSGTSQNISVGAIGNDGYLRIRPSDNIKKGEYIYMSGVYFADKFLEV